MATTISHYQLEEELGAGGMGRVHKAFDTTLDRTVVLKLLAPDLIAEDESRKRFLREARLASALDHPNICTIYEIAEVDQQYFIAMQYVQGKTLNLALGFSHPVKMPIPEGLTVTVEKGALSISGFDKELVGQFAANIRALKKPEPYKGKGIRYDGEVIRRKQGKKAA